MMIAAKVNGVYVAFEDRDMDGIIYVPPGVPYKGATKPCSILTVTYDKKEKEFWGGYC